MTVGLDELQKALDEWWKDYNHLLGDASGDSECRRKLQNIVKLFSAFQRTFFAKERLLRKLLENAPKYDELDDIGGMCSIAVQMWGAKVEKWIADVKSVFDETFG